MAKDNSAQFDRDILKRCIAKDQSVDEKDVVIDSAAIGNGAKPGDGYMCEVRAVSLKVTVAGKAMDLEYIAKVIPEAKDRAALVNETNLFDVECEVYSKLLPALQKITKKKEHNVSVPNCFYASTENKLIIMENLRAKGFSMSEKTKGFDLDHAKLVLTQFANLHASSYHLEQTHKGKGEGFKKEFPLLDRGDIFNFGSDILRNTMLEIFTNPFVILLKVLRVQWSNDQSKLDRLEAFERTWYEHYKQISKLEDSDFMVVNFGDCWLNNMMFRRDSAGKPLEVKLYDLQITCRASPVYDLVYFFMSSVPPVLRKTHLKELLEFYHQQLDERLTCYGYKEAYTLEQLRKDYKNKYLYGFVASGCHTQLALAPSHSGEAIEVSKSENAEEQMKNQESQRQHQLDMALNTPAIRTRMMEVAEEAMEMGLF